MRGWQIASGLIAVFGPALIIAYDLIARIVGGHQATITFQVQQWQKSYPEIAYAAGGLFLWLWLHLFFAGIFLGGEPHGGL